MAGETRGDRARRGGGRQRGHARADGARGDLRRPAHAGADDGSSPTRARPRSPSSPACPTTSSSCWALHEGSVVGHGHRLRARRAARRPSPCCTRPPGLGNAVSALATARVNRAPLVVMVGQQDRRHLAQEPFLAGRLDGLAGEYPVSVEQPVRAQDVPGALVRAYHAAATRARPRARHRADGRLARAGARGPRGDRPRPPAARRRRGARGDRRARRAARGRAVARARGRRRRRHPGGLGRARGARRAPRRARCAPRPSAPARASRRTIRSSPATSPPAARGCARCSPRTTRSSPSARRSSASTPTSPARWSTPGTRLALVTDDPAEAHRSPSQLTVLAEPSAVCRGLVARPAARARARSPGRSPSPPRRRRRRPASRCAPGHVFAALAERLPADAILVEESPSSRPELHARVPARVPMGFLSAAMGGLGFALPGHDRRCAWRCPTARCVAVLGDGSSLYAIQALWSAARYGVGALFVVMANGRYAIMDKLAADTGKPAPWPAFDTIDIAAIARALGLRGDPHRGPRRPARAARRGASGAGAARHAARARDRRRTLTLKPAAAGADHAGEERHEHPCAEPEGRSTTTARCPI